MPETNRRSPARLLAPIALVAFAIAVLIVLASSGTGGGDDTGGSSAGSSAPAAGETAPTTPEQPARPRRRNYTVKAGDNLDLIAEKTGVAVDTLQELNPEVDPQALVIGQTIKLRE